MRLHTSKYQDLKTDTYVFDACVWIYINSPFGYDAKNQHATAEYSKLLKNLMQDKKRIVFPFTIVSEYVNRVIRWGHQTASNNGYTGTFKDFRNSPHAAHATKLAMAFSKNIFAIGTPVCLGFDKMTYADFDTALSGGGIDINDRAVSLMCANEDYALVTHDRDFKTESINLLSVNNNLLRP